MIPSVWQPDEVDRDAELYLVGGLSSDQRLYLILEGPPLPPPRFKDDPERPVPMVALRVFTATGHELPGGASVDIGKEGRRPRTYLWDGPLPPDPAEPLIVQLRNFDGSMIWEVRLRAVQP